jgi:DNA-binding transcriptional ArsR family regulator
MEDISAGNKAYWHVKRSIAMELDLALTLVYGYFVEVNSDHIVNTFRTSLPSDWQNEGLNYLGKPERMISLFEFLAFMSGVLFEQDYRKATLGMRVLDFSSALQFIRDQAQERGIAVDTSLSDEIQFDYLFSELFSYNYRSLGFEMDEKRLKAKIVKNELQCLRNILAGMEQHDAFWMWLDRFYYQSYQPWVKSRQSIVDNLTNKAAMILGSDRTKPVLDLSWLPAQNPLLRYPQLANAVERSDREIVFLIEPFGMFDVWSVIDQKIIVTFAEPDIYFENFKGFVEDVAARTKALADPTRLIILRLIRNFEMYNTGIADILNLSRPTVSVHAKILREAGLIESVSDGRAVRHKINPIAVQKLFEDLSLLLRLREIIEEDDNN